MKIKKIKPAAQAHKYPLLIKSILADSLKYEPGHEIFYRDIFKMDYYELNRRVRQMANVLQTLGIDGGETIGFMDYDSHRFLEGFFAIPMTGNVLHTINWRLSEEQVLYTINHAEDSLLIIHEDFLPIINTIWAKLTTVKTIIICNDNPVNFNNKKQQQITGSRAIYPALPIVDDYETLRQAAGECYDFPDFDEDAIATTFYTTGTTGNPKGVYFSHRQLVLHTLVNAAMYGGALDKCFANFNSSAVFLGLTPFFHVHGWGFPYYATMIGAKQVYAGRFSADYFVSLFKEHQPTLTTGVPSILQMILNHPDTQGFNFSNMKMLIGGSALSSALAKQALERGIDVLSGYGMSEAAPMICAAYLSAAQARTLSIDEQIGYRAIAGVPAFLVDIKVVDSNGNTLPQDGESLGEIVIRSPWLTQGYYKEPEKSDELWLGGWMRTGDVATIDARSNVRIGDRIKDVIKTGGEWINSIDLENIMGQHSAITEVAVVGLPDEKWGERPHAMVVLEKGKIASVESIKQVFTAFIESKQLTKWSLPDRVIFVDALPKTSVGKVDKKLIRKMIQDLL